MFKGGESTGLPNVWEINFANLGVLVKSKLGLQTRKESGGRASLVHVGGTTSAGGTGFPSSLGVRRGSGGGKVDLAF